MSAGGGALAATAVWATVAEALRAGEAACHRNQFTAIWPALEGDFCYAGDAMRLVLSLRVAICISLRVRSYDDTDMED